MPTSFHIVIVTMDFEQGDEVLMESPNNVFIHFPQRVVIGQCPPITVTAVVVAVVASCDGDMARDAAPRASSAEQNPGSRKLRRGCSTTKQHELLGSHNRVRRRPQRAS